MTLGLLLFVVFGLTVCAVCGVLFAMSDDFHGERGPAFAVGAFIAAVVMVCVFASGMMHATGKPINWGVERSVGK